MKSLKAITILKHPRSRVWAALRDEAPSLLPLMEDIQGIWVKGREESPDGTVRVITLWRANPQLPPALASLIPSGPPGWTDWAEWRPDGCECHWRIEPDLLAQGIRCDGVTRYEEAMGGRGTRITFEGTLDVTIRGITGVPIPLEGMIADGVEGFIQALIPKNFRKLTTALSHYLDAERDGPPRP